MTVRPRKRSTVEDKEKGGGASKTGAVVSKMKSRKKRGTVEEKAEACDSNWKPEAKKNAESFMKKYAEMGISGMKDEFGKMVQDYRNPQYGDAAFRANAVKNRHKDVPILDDSRVALDNKDYVYASWAYDLTRLGRRYIITQIPLESTIEDFYKMVFEHKAICIVVLCDKTEKGEEVMPDFWPTNIGDFKDYGKMAVSNKKTEDVAKEKITVLEVLPDGCSNSHLVHLVHSTGWDAQPVFNQTSARNILKSIKVIARLESLSEGPIILMDEHAGISRASVLTTVDVTSGLLFRESNPPKVFETARWLRRCKHMAIRNEDDYVAVIKTVFEYLFRTNQEKFNESYVAVCGRAEE